MADAPQNGSNGSDRLDSWKAIAAYLQRDESTVRRWEREQGLPIRRVPGGRGASVFAYVPEIDAWLKSTSGASAATPEATPQAIVESPRRSQTRRRAWLVAATIVLMASVGWFVRRPHAGGATLNVKATPTAFIALDGTGREVWRQAFPGERIEVPPRAQPADVFSGDRPVVIAATSLQISTPGDAVRGGQLFALTPQGALQRTFSFDDRLVFGNSYYERPWGITDFRVDDRAGSRRIALAAHHYQWWPSVVTVLDDQWRRGGTFVNAGWVEHLRWLSADRLVISGFSEPRDGGMVALLDASTLAGQSPPANDSRFDCTTCDAGRPLRYVVMPRSEVNRVSGSRFNRGVLEIQGNRVLVHTIEAQPTQPDVIDAVYEFTPSLDLVNASFSDRYWEFHRSLEEQGKLNHTREQCPDRDGPREVQVWEPQTGWRTKSLGPQPKA